jgi:uncharacterized RDD family membrane protein YckC
MPDDKSFESFTMFEEWSRQQESLKARAAIPRPPKLEPASWGKRVGAYIIDSLLLTVPTAVYAFNGVFAEFQAAVPGMVDPVTGEADPAAVQELAARFAGVQLKWTLAYLILATVYYVVLHGWRGQTLGKMVFGMKVVDEDRRPIGMGRAFKRALAFPIASVVPFVGSLFGLLNGLWPIWDERKQSLGDKLARTLVVEEVEQPFSAALSGGSAEL